ncbi:MAG TPA: hypothetical protein VEX15_01815 [Nocardioidaceae bacterium]|nr:hypothetical protein [Nocardioidaceae bacterium]
MNPEERAESMARAEEWLESKGLPYFVYHQRRSLVERHQRGRIVGLVLVALVLSSAVGVGVETWTSTSAGIGCGLAMLLVLVLGYGWTFLRLRPIVLWAIRRTLSSLRLMFPLLTRALPLLLLFITFLFINTEVWQVASTLSRQRLWMGVLLFATIAVLFLLVRLPDEVRQVEADAADDRLVESCRGTPVARVAATLRGDARPAKLTPMPRANLVLVLLFSQLVQVVVLSLVVYVFFIVFGKLAIGDEVIISWVGPVKDHVPNDLPSLGEYLPISEELFQVSVFLAAFSGLYFTVYAVTDSTYREQFFTDLSHELEQAIGVYTVYETLRHESAADPSP